MYKRVFSIFLVSVLFTLGFNCNAHAVENTVVSAESAVLIVADSGEIVWEKNAEKQMPMASTTKIMTSLLAIEHGNPGMEITVDAEMVAVEGTSMGLLPGDTVTLDTLVSGMLLESGNDAANVTAYAVSGGVPQFVGLMNEKAREIGMANTSFATPSGLDDENHYSTAFDMALLGAYAIKNPQFSSVCAQKSEVVYYGNPPYRRVLTNHNKLISMVDGCVGIKTGFTKKSGRCLVSAVTRNHITLVAVTLNAPDDWNDHKKLYEYGFSEVENQNLPSDISANRLKVVGSDKTSVGISLLYAPYLPTANGNMQITMRLTLKPFEYAPLEAGRSVGTAYYICGDQVIAEVPVVTAESAELLPGTKNKKTLIEKIKDFFRKNFGENND